MKLNELSAPKPSRQAAKVFESYFGKGFQIENLTDRQARGLLSRVRGLVLEHRRSHSFHHSEKNPAYLKLMMMENVLSTLIGETAASLSEAKVVPSMGKFNVVDDGKVVATYAAKYEAQERAAHINADKKYNAKKKKDVKEDALPGLGGTTNPADQAKMKAAQTQAIQKIQDPKLRTAMTKAKSGQNLSPDEQKTVASAAMGSPMQTEASDEELVKRMRLQRIPYKVYQELVKKHDRLSANKSKDPNILKQLKDLEGILSGDVKWSSNTATNESRRSLRRALRESEIQQAQVVLAAQDMVDNVQKMIEQATSMQYKDLPALVSQVRNEMGIDQAGQFKTDASAALSQLVQSLEESRQQLEEALGVVTGQEPLGGDMGDDMGGGLPDMDDDLGGEDDFDFDADLGDDSDIDTDLDIDVDSDEVPVGNLGRNRI
jgi:hypothetical protein